MVNRFLQPTTFILVGGLCIFTSPFLPWFVFHFSFNLGSGSNTFSIRGISPQFKNIGYIILCCGSLAVVLNISFWRWVNTIIIMTGIFASVFSVYEIFGKLYEHASYGLYVMFIGGILVIVGGIRKMADKPEILESKE